MEAHTEKALLNFLEEMDAMAADEIHHRDIYRHIEAILGEQHAHCPTVGNPDECALCCQNFRSSVHLKD